MEIKEIHSKQEWEGFLAATAPASFLQSWHWGEFNETTGHKIWRLGFYSAKGGSSSGGEHGTLVGVAFVLKVTARRGAFLFCPHGPLLRPDLLASLTEFLIPLAKHERCVFIRISPLMEATVANDKAFTDLGYRNAPIHMMHPELAWILDITPSEDQLLAGMRKTTRYSIKKAEKDGVVITTSSDPNDFEKFYNVYKETVRRQEFKAFSEEYFKTEVEIFFREHQGMFFFAEYRGEVVGGAVIIFYGNSAFYHHGATNRKFPGLTDAQLLQWTAIKEAKRRGLKYYNFWGVVPEDKKKHPWAGLSLFKRGFGGSEQAYVHAKDYRLSHRYWLTYAIEKARKIKRRL